jgi:hypothetical protein
MRGCRGREDVERMRGREDDKKRIGWEQRYRVCRGAVDFMGRDLLCHKEDGRRRRQMSRRAFIDREVDE